MPPMFGNWKTLLISTALGGAFLLGSGSAVWAADEGLQVQMLKQMFRLPHPEWSGILRENSSLLDQSFFQRLDERIRWSADNNQIDDAIRFSMVGDFACDAVGRMGGYRLALILSFQKGGNDDLARTLIDNVMLSHPDFAEVRYLRAAYRRSDGDWAGALDDYQFLVGKGFKPDECYYFIGAINLGLNKEKEAYDAFKMSKLPIAQVEIDKLKYVDSSTPFSGIAPLNPQPITGDPKLFAEYLKQAEIAEKAGKLSEAENNYSKAAAANPRASAPYLYLGALRYRLGKVSLGIEDLRRGLTLDPKNVEGWRFLGCSFERRFDTSQSAADLNDAKMSYKRALENKPGDPVSEMSLQRLESKKPKAPAQ